MSAAISRRECSAFSTAGSVSDSEGPVSGIHGDIKPKLSPCAQDRPRNDLIARTGCILRREPWYGCCQENTRYDIVENPGTPPYRRVVAAVKEGYICTIVADLGPRISPALCTVWNRHSPKHRNAICLIV